MGIEEHRGQAPARIRFAIITVSDTRDATTDGGGAFLVDSVEGAGHEVIRRQIVRDEPEDIRQAVSLAVNDTKVDLVLTTGGTGIAPRDVTYDTLRGFFDSEIPGFGELFRWLSYEQVGSATILSRALGGVFRGKVVLALPGSTKALGLAMKEIVLREAGHLVAQAGAPRS